MKRFTFLLIVLAAVLVPTLADAGGTHQFVYRPELRQWVPVPEPPAAAPSVVTRTPAEVIARHEAMAHAYRGTRMAQAAVHCDRLINEAREALRKQS